jgi:hypothetical protein
VNKKVTVPQGRSTIVRLSGRARVTSLVKLSHGVASAHGRYQNQPLRHASRVDVDRRSG